MRKLRLIVTALVLGTVTVAIAAAPGAKKASTARVVPPSVSRGGAGSDAVKPVERNVPGPVEETAPAEDVLPEAEFVAPDSEIPTTQSPAPAGVSSAPINMDWYSINNGGAIEVAAGNIKMGLSIGQNAVGEVSAGNIKMGLGFWYGAGAVCPCECHADPVCDSVTDIFDVTQMVNVAFRNAPAILDPNVQCTRQTTDVTCDGVTDIFDVTRMVNVAFRNGNPAVEFCQPCISAPTL